MPQDFTAAQVLTAAQMDTLSAAVDGYATTATAAGTTTLTFASMFQQFFTGATTQTVVMPVASTCYIGWKIRIVNNSSGVVTVQSSGANTIYAVPAGGDVIFTCILASGTTAASWDYKDYKAVSASGLTFIRRSSFSAVADTGTTFDNVFSTSYYQYLVRIESLYAATGADDLLLQMRYAGPTTETGATYTSSAAGVNASAGALSNYSGGGLTSAYLAENVGDSTYIGAGEINFTGVGNTAELPRWWARYQNLTGNSHNSFISGTTSASRTYLGFLLKSSTSNITGTISVYGLAKA